MDPRGDGPWWAATGAGTSLDRPRRAGLREGDLRSPPPLMARGKLMSLPVQGHDPQAGDRAARPHSPPLPLPQTLETQTQGERELACPTVHRPKLIGVQEDVLACPGLARRRSREAVLAEAQPVRSKDQMPAERAAPPSGSGALCSGRNARSSGCCALQASSTDKGRSCKPAPAAC